MDSVILIDKPAGITSFKVTASVRHKLGIKKAGHAGTLDPLASGVLPVMTGRATRLIDLIPDEKKRYVAGFMLGLTTDTLDNEGDVLTDQPVNVTDEQIAAVVQSFCGEISQTPPMYSALKKDGVKLYELARRGETVERKSRIITIYSIKLTDLRREGDLVCGVIDVTCSKGTYIRTLIDDIGMKLHCGAIMTSLRREASNGFDVSQCVPLDEFMSTDDVGAYCHMPDFAVMQYNSVNVTAAQAKRFSNGGELDIIRLKNADLSEADTLRVYYNGKFLGLGAVKDAALRPICVFNI